MAGKRKGNEDDRHLWPELLRVIKEVKPTWVVGENVYGLVNWSNGLVFHEIISDLENAGYEVQPYLIPAVGVDAPHRRDRLWIVAHSTDNENRNRLRTDGNGEKKTQDQWGKSRFEFGKNGEVAENTIGGRCLHGEHDEEGTGVREQRESCTGSSDGIYLQERIATNPVTNLCGRRRTVGQGGNDGIRGFCITETEQAGNDLRSETERCNTDDGEERNDSNTINQGLQRSKNNGNIRKGRENGNKQFTGFLQPTFDKFPTQRPIRLRDDGVSSKLLIFVVKELYDKISNTSKENRIENMQEVWKRVSSPEVWEQIRGLYSLESKTVLFQTMQLYSSGNVRQDQLSPFGEKLSEPVLSKLRKYGEFRCTPQGQELQKQRDKQFNDSLSFLPHEIPLAAKAFETAITKFETWHRNESIKAYGNAVVPQVVYQIFKAINEYEEMNR